MEHGGVTDGHDGRVVQDHDLSGERLGNGRRIVDRACNVSPLDVVLGYTADVESDVVTRKSLGEYLVVHLDGFDLTDDVGGLEGDLHVGLQYPGLNPAYRDGSDTGDGVNILNRQPEGLLGVLLGNLEVIESLEERRALVPGRVGGGRLDVVAHVGGGGYEGDLVHFYSYHRHQLGHSGYCVLVLRFVVFHSVHLVDGDYDLLDAEGRGEEDVLFRLRLGPLYGGAGDDRGVSLAGTGDHVLDEVPVSRGVNDCEVVFVGVELLVTYIDGDSSLSFFFEAVHDPREVEGAFSLLLCLLLVFLNYVRVNRIGLQKDPSGKRGLSVVDVTDDDQVHVLFLCHLDFSLFTLYRTV